MGEKKNTVFIDLLRILAAFLVIVNHTNSQIFLAETPDSPLWYLSLTWFSVSRIAVALFMMITGYLMLDRPQSWRKTFYRALRIFLVIPLFSLPHYILNLVHGTVEHPGIWDFLKTVYTTSMATGFWYLYLYLAVVICLPFIQKFAAACSKRDLLIYIGLAGIVATVLPFLEQYLPGTAPYGGFKPPMVNLYLLLMLLGYYFKKYPLTFRGVRIVCVGVYLLSLLGGIALSRWEYAASDGASYLEAFHREHITVVLPAAATFCFWSTVPFGERLGRFLRFWAPLTFGVYLLSDLLIALTDAPYISLAAVIGRFPAMLIYEVGLFTAAALITWVLKKIPLLKRLL